MNTRPSLNASSHRKWWILLIITIVVGPFFPFVVGGLEGKTGYEGLMLGAALWPIAVIIASSMLGWRLTAGRATGARVGLTCLFIVGAVALGLGVGYAECALL